MLSIAQKAVELGVSVVTLRRWHKKGLLIPEYITEGGHRRYKKQKSEDNRITVGYSSKKNVTYYVSCIKQNIVEYPPQIKKKT